MKQRVITGAFIGAGFILLYFVLPLWCAVAAFGALSAIGAYELLFKTNSIKRHGFLYFSAVAAFLVAPASVYGGGKYMVPLIFVYAIGAFAFAVFDHKAVTFSILAKGFLAAIILPLMLTSMLRIYAAMPMISGVPLVPWLLVWVCDSAALFVGRAFGKKKLAPYVSPKKTVAGFVGGLAGGALVMTGWAIYLMVNQGMMPFYLILSLIIFGAFAAALGQMGDLALSVIKRECNIKDYGNLFPGHGGVWDRFDSIAFVGPIFEILFLYLVII